MVSHFGGIVLQFSELVEGIGVVQFACFFPEEAGGGNPPLSLRQFPQEPGIRHPPLTRDRLRGSLHYLRCLSHASTCRKTHFYHLVRAQMDLRQGIQRIIQGG